MMPRENSWESRAAEVANRIGLAHSGEHRGSCRLGAMDWPEAADWCLTSRHDYDRPAGRPKWRKAVDAVPYWNARSYSGHTLMLRYLLLSLIVFSARAAEPGAIDPVQSALAACAAMQQRFADTSCVTSTSKSGTYRVEIKAATPDAMRVVFMRSLDVADLICKAGHKVELVQQLKDADGTNTVRWAINPKECGITRVPG